MQPQRLDSSDGLTWSLYGCEEYELIVTIKSKHWRLVEDAVMQKGGALLKIGRTTAEKVLRLKYRSKMAKIEARGYKHFKYEGSG
ncbi:MAG: hypothetical protein NWE91_05550 [Candidatus Bathyarchaeota archaeon]|nr:hypothetical protein [Candidatus Bathyarchaeota archaeon]